ncbi:MAG: sugar phosphate isomerase/epimerase family protein [Bacillota bacterium]
MKPGFSTKICPDYSFEEICDLAEKTGFYHVEFQVERDQKHGLDKLATALPEREKVKKLLLESEIEPRVIATYVNLSRKSMDNIDDTLNRLRKWSKIAGELGTRYLRVFPPTGYSDESNITKMIKMVSEAVADYPVAILIENHGSMSTGKQMRTVLDRAGVNNVAAIWDIGHTIVHGETVAETYDYLSPYLKHVHIKDFARIKEKDNDNPYDSWKKFVQFGAGDMPLREFFSLLKNKGYDGALSVEIQAKYDSVENYLLEAKKLIQNS